jgi:hypothetical protein
LQADCGAINSTAGRIDTKTSGIPEDMRQRVACSPVDPVSTPSTALKTTSGTDAHGARSAEFCTAGDVMAVRIDGLLTPL